MKKSKKILLNVIAFLIIALYVFVDATNLNPLYQSGAFFWCVVITIFIVLNIIINVKKENFTNVFNNETGKPVFEGRKAIKVMPLWTKIVLIGIWGIFIIAQIFSSVFFHQTAYRDQLGKPISKEFGKNMQAIDTNQVPIIDKVLAADLASKKLGEKPSLGSQVTLGEPTIQMVDGKLVWVVPLRHSGFMKWLFNMEGVPGYIVVSATSDQDVTYVEDHLIKYQPDLYLLDDLERHVRMGSNGALFKGITDMSFELDDNGVPYYVISTYKNLRGFALPEADGVILCNATTGKMEKYDLKNVPQWVDRVQPEDFIINQIANQGDLVHGIFNFSNKDKFMPSAGFNIIYNNGNCYLFTGITSVGADESAIGFMMVDMVTKQPILYTMSGATEYAGQKSAEGKVENFGYKATFPIILNVDGEPTYFMTLKDKAGLIKQYAYVNVKNYSVVGTGVTVAEAERDYKKMLGNTNNSPVKDDSVKAEKITGTIKRIASEVQNGVTLYKIILNEKDDKIFYFTYDISQELALGKEGDSVEIEYYNQKGPIVEGISFFNNSFLNIKGATGEIVVSTAEAK